MTALEETPKAGKEPLPPEFFNSPGKDPHGWNAALRAGCPVHKIDHPPGAEAYVVADYATALKAFTDPRLSKRVEAAPQWFQEQLRDASPVLIKNMITADPPDHTRLRKLVTKAFTPRRMELLRPRIQQITDDLIDEFPESGTVDLMKFAYSLPMRVISEFLRVPDHDRPQVQADVVMLSEAPYPDEERNRLLRVASDKIEQYLLDLLAERRKDLGDDLVSVLIRAADEDDVFTEDELVSTLVLLIIAGHKTTANLIGNGTQALLQHPDQLELLVRDPSLAESAVEEFLRFEAPVFRGTLRIATEDITLNGVDIAKESFVHLLLSSANRDPEAFENPDRLDITRTPNKHFAFGHGAHFCAGAPLSRVEGSIAFPTMLRRLRGLRLAVRPDELEWIFDNSTSRGLATLPISYDARLPR
ncbi:cytochrome P450 family protein [Kibdelosporangium phytohabitans]|uniref:cytochrome P450 family protein n=1 Tax=Kibdelosporangium phytohabitans TaxID=860235 RepID=UPI000A528502|nr:cytochrome P450 [Kibdelosporangium phytohabitans]MBE1462140.1 cytochrome P450 [Kibdelosporangium phytohabitans]